MIAALFRRIRSRKARRQARWMRGYIRARYGDAAQQRALEDWEAYRP